MRLHENFQESFGVVYQLRILNSFGVDQVNRATGTVSIHVFGAKLATVKTTCDVKDSSTREVNQSPVPNVTSIHRKLKTSACQVNPFSHHDYHDYSSFYLHRYIIILVFHLVLLIFMVVWIFGFVKVERISQRYYVISNENYLDLIFSLERLTIIIIKNIMNILSLISMYSYYSRVFFYC